MEQLGQVTGELAIYHNFAIQMWMGKLPYKDFFPEYPPLAMPFFWFAQLFGTQWFTLLWYTEVFFAIFFLSLLIYKLRGNPYIFLAVIFPLEGLLWDRYDIFPALFTFGSLYLAKSKRFFPAAFLLGIGTLIKIYPILLLPVIFFWQYQYFPTVKKLFYTLFFFLIPFFIILGIILGYGGKKGLIKFAEFQGKRGIMLESIRAMPIILEGKRRPTYQHNTYEF